MPFSTSAHFAAFLLSAAIAFGQADQSIRVPSANRKPLSDDELSRIDQAKATVYSVDDAKAILDSLKKKGEGGEQFDPTAKDFYCVIHVVTWKEEKGENDDTKQLNVKAQNWLVYRPGSWDSDRFKGRRIFGSRNVWMLAIHTGAALKYMARYDVNFKQLTPAPLEHLFALASVVKGAAGGESDDTTKFYSLTKLEVAHVPSEISIQALADADESKSVIGSLGEAVPFVNEGRYRFDFGVAASISKLSQLKFDAKNLTAAPEKVGTSTAFGTVNFYPFPVDVRTQSFSPYPYVVLGAGIGSQPLHRMLFALGWGPKFAQFYAGAALVKDSGLGDKRSFSPQFSFGVLLPVRGFAEMLKENK